MKKICIVLFVILLTCILNACETAETEIYADLDMYVQEHRVVIYRERDYKKYIRTEELPTPLPVTYDQLEALGKFYHFESSPLNYGYETMYGFVDAANIVCTLVLPLPESGCHYGCEYKDPPLAADHSDMRSIPYEDANHCIYTVDGLTYLYHTGKLKSVHWTQNGQHFIFFADCLYYPDGGVEIRDYNEYPIEADTFAAKLLNVETARAAVDELMASCFPED